MSELLRSLVSYNAWANKDLLDTLATVDPVAQADELKTAIRLLNHSHIVARIFAAHLSGRPHAYTADNTADTPSLADLRADLLAIDQWYLDYVDTVPPSAWGQRIAFRFTDGDSGFMSRQEMVTHMTLHGGYHRGEIGLILKWLQVPVPWDTYAVFLHQSEPLRRRQGNVADALV